MLFRNALFQIEWVISFAGINMVGSMKTGVERVKFGTGYWNRVLALLIGAGMVGLCLTAWGFIVLWVWPTVVGAIVVTIAQRWRIARMAVLYDPLALGENTAAGAR